MQKLKFAGITVAFTMAAAAFFTLTDVQNVMADEKSNIKLNVEGKAQTSTITEADRKAIAEAFDYDVSVMDQIYVAGDGATAYIDWDNSAIPFWKVYETDVFQPVMHRDKDGKLVVDKYQKDDVTAWWTHISNQYTDPSKINLIYGLGTLFTPSTPGSEEDADSSSSVSAVINQNLNIKEITDGSKKTQITDAYVIRVCYTTDDKLNYQLAERPDENYYCGGDGHGAYDVNGNYIDFSSNGIDVDDAKVDAYNADRKFGYTDFWILPEGVSTVLNFDENADDYTGLKKDSGDWYYFKDGVKDTSYTGLCKYNGSWWYVKNGKVDFSATTLCKYNGAWFYVKGGKVDFSATTLCKYNGTWFYVKNGKVDFGATTLCKYNGTWWYVRNGKVDFSTTTLCKYNGAWFYVKGGKVDFNATTLCKYNGTWWYVKGGKIDFKSTTLCKYNGTWFYVNGGKVNFSANGLCKYNGVWWYIKNGSVSFTNTLCKFNGTWWYINNGAVNFNKTTLVKYGNNWYAVAGGKVAWGYTGNLKYNGGTYRVVKGVVKF